LVIKPTPQVGAEGVANHQYRAVATLGQFEGQRGRGRGRARARARRVGLC
jgi:hypothetical protein